MTLRSLTLSALLLLLGALPVRADDVAALTDLARRASASDRPAATFLSDLDTLSDGTEIDRLEVDAATASMPSGVVADLLRGVTSIRKVGNLVTIERSEVKTIPFGERSLRFDRRVRLAFDRGELTSLQPADRDRLGAADPAKGFLRLRPIGGVTLDRAPVRTIVAVEEAGQAVTHVATGSSGDVSWTRVDGPAPASTPATHQAPEAAPEPQPADGISRQLEERVTRPISESTQSAQLPQSELGLPQSELGEPELTEEPLAADELQDLLAAEREGLLDAPSATEAPIAPADGGLAGGPQVSDEGSVIAEAPEVVVPPAEEQATIDADVDTLAAEFEGLTEELRSLKELWEEDRERATRALEAQLEALRADNARLEVQLAELRTAREAPVAVDGPDVDRAGAVSGPKVGSAEPIRKGGAAGDTAKEGDEELKPLERMILALLEGITKMLQEQLAQAAVRNLETRAAIVSDRTAPAYRPYADARLGTTIGASPVVSGPQWNGDRRTRVLRILPGQPLFARPVAPAATPIAPANTPIAPANTPIAPAPGVTPIPVGGPSIGRLEPTPLERSN